jgi:hypothetical protein
MMLGLCDGSPHHFVARLPTTPRPGADLFHVGGVSHPWEVNGIWAFRGGYFWRRALETCAHQDLQSHYQRMYPIGSAASLLERYPEQAEGMGKEFRQFCEELVTHRGFVDES